MVYEPDAVMTYSFVNDGLLAAAAAYTELRRVVASDALALVANVSETVLPTLPPGTVTIVGIEASPIHYDQTFNQCPLNRQVFKSSFFIVGVHRFETSPTFD
jgi:hypothetical protein